MRSYRPEMSPCDVHTIPWGIGRSPRWTLCPLRASRCPSTPNPSRFLRPCPTEKMAEGIFRTGIQVRAEMSRYGRVGFYVTGSLVYVHHIICVYGGRPRVCRVFSAKSVSMAAPRFLFTLIFIGRPFSADGLMTLMICAYLLTCFKGAPLPVGERSNVHSGSN